MKNNKLASDPELNEAHSLMMKHLETKENTATYFGTLLACAKGLGDYIVKNNSIRDLPREVQHLLAITWNNVAIIYMPEKLIDIKAFDMEHQNYFEAGFLDDRFARMVRQLYEICKEEKLL